MLVKEVMSSPVVTVRPGTSLKEATQLLASWNITAMPVVDGHGHLVGVISEADVIQDAVLPDGRAHEVPVRHTGGPRQTRVSDVMSHHTLTVEPGTDLSEAADLMVSTTVKSLPVVDRGEVVGMISRRDIVHVIARRDELVEGEIDDLFRVSGVDWVADVKDGVVTVDGPETVNDRELAEVLVSTVRGVVAVHCKP